MSTFKRPDGRANDALRPITIEVGVSKFAEGSARISFGSRQLLVGPASSLVSLQM